MATAAKTKSSGSLSETTPNSKATSRISKVSRVGGVTKSDTDSHSSSLGHNPRLSVDRSPRSVTSKPAVPVTSKPAVTVTSKPAIERKSTTKPITPSSDKKPTLPRVAKPSELQNELVTVQEDLKIAKEKLAVVEKEKGQALEELKGAKKLTDEANEKLTEALVAQKRAEEDSEIEKFRAVEMEQSGIEAAKKKEDEWQREVEAVRNQHAVDVAALLSATQELQRVKQEHTMILDAKNEALSHAEEATKIAEMQAAKVETLAAEVARLKSLLNARMESEADENAKLISEMDLEIETLKQELEEARRYEEKLVEKEASLEQLNVELEAARMAESYAHSLMDEWKRRVEDLEAHSNETKRLERSASESLQSVMKQLEESNDSLHSAESEVVNLKEKVGLLEISMKRQKRDLDETERRLEMATEAASLLEKKVESLTSEIESKEEEKLQALNNEKLAAANVQTLLEEKNKLITELESSRDEEEKSKKAMESLTSALHEVSSEAREAKENFLNAQAEIGHHEAQIEDLKLVLKETNENYKILLDDAKQEIDDVTNSNERSKQEYEVLKAEWDQNELHLFNSLKKTEEEKSSLEKEISRLVNMHKEAGDEAGAAKDGEMRVKNLLDEAESEVNYLKDLLGEAKAESMNLKESLLDKESEFQNILQENEELRNSESGLHQKIAELSRLLDEALTKKEIKGNGDLTDSEKDYDMLPKVVEFSEQNGGGSDEKPKFSLPSPPQSDHHHHHHHQAEENLEKVERNITIETVNHKESSNGKPTAKEDDDSIEADSKMWESYKVGAKDFSPEAETEAEQSSFEEDLDSKADGSEAATEVSLSETHENGAISPSKQQQSQKKKKPLLKKFGNLLKSSKKGSSNSNQK